VPNVGGFASNRDEKEVVLIIYNSYEPRNSVQQICSLLLEGGAKCS
jgi:hypothetical protein